MAIISDNDVQATCHEVNRNNDNNKQDKEEDVDNNNSKDGSKFLYSKITRQLINMGFT